jgi:hypothetical protein
MTMNDDKPMDLLPELAVQRALLAQYIERVSSGHVIVKKDFENISNLADDVVKTTATIAKVRNETALTIAEIKFIQNGMLRLMEKYVPDTERRRNFIEELRGLLPDGNDANGEEALSVGAKAASRIA